MPDPFYQQIRNGLEGDLDPKVFEAAAVDLLRGDYPGIAPVSGGSDFGMDGAIPDLEAEAFPLISTTSPAAIENLTGSITTNIASRNSRHKAVFATPRALTPTKRKNIEARARELGITLVNIHDQADFVQRLYRNSHWCRTLLGLTGNPPALSVVPLSSRPNYNLPSIGREATFDWIRSLGGDGLLVGQPGSGKTFILQKLAVEEGRGLFAVSRDRSQLASSIRDQDPEVIFLDDAHANLELLNHLRQIRAELEAEYRILATSWPSGTGLVAERLGVPVSVAHNLPLLTRNEILSVVEGAGITGPAPLQYEIVSQAQGRPGLAVTLAHAVIAGSAMDLISGHLLERLVDAVARDVSDTRARQILASLAIGGDSGHRLSSVSKVLSMDLASVHNVVVTLGQAGIVKDRGDCLVVTPPALGQALTRDVFFSGQLTLPREVFLELFDSAPSRSAAAENLLEARVRGAKVPLERAAAVAEEYGKWQALARSGEDALEWILRSRPERIKDIPATALDLAPRRALELLLAEIGKDTSAVHSNPEHPLRVIQDWAKDPRGHPDPLSRRELLVAEVNRWLDAGGVPATAVLCMPAIFDLELEYGELDPGAGNRFTIHSAAFSSEGYAALAAHFPRALEMLRGQRIEDWEPVLQVVGDWVYARVRDHNHAPIEDIREHGLQMLRQLAAFASTVPAVIHRLREMCLTLGLDDELESDRVLETVFPLGYWRSSNETHRELASSKLEALAVEWSQLTVDEILTNLALVEAAEPIVGQHRPNLTSDLCRGIARRVEDPVSLAAGIVQRHLPRHFLSPVLQEAVTRGGVPGGGLLSSLLEVPDYLRVAFLVALSNEETPKDAKSRAIELAPKVPDLVGQVAWTPTVAGEVKRQLLDHPDARVSGEAVESLVYSYRKGTLPNELIAPWKAALVRYGSKATGFVVSEAVRGDSVLALDWLRSALTSREYRVIGRDDAIAAAIAELTVDQRISLIGEDLAAGRGVDSIVVRLVVGENPRVYAELLEVKSLNRYHLAPLAITSIDFKDAVDVSDSWIAMARLALDREFSPRQIVQALTAQGWSHSGDESRLWDVLRSKFAELDSSDHAGVREVGKLAKVWFTSRADEARARERDEAVYGR